MTATQHLSTQSPAEDAGCLLWKLPSVARTDRTLVITMEAGNLLRKRGRGPSDEHRFLVSLTVWNAVSLNDTVITRLEQMGSRGGGLQHE